MACSIAQLLLRVEPASLFMAAHPLTANKEPPFEQLPHSAASFRPQQHHQLLLKLDNYEQIALETRLKWVTKVTEYFVGGASKPDDRRRGCGVRDFDIILKSDGSIENLAEEAISLSTTPVVSEKAQLKEYPARYQIPRPILENIDSLEEKIKRTEHFALGCILYQLISGHDLHPDLGDNQEDGIEIQRRYIEGLFPDDLWALDKAVRVLACWSPEFAYELYKKRNNALLPKLNNYIKNHPIKFSLQVAGGVLSLASLAVSPILGALGFAAIGPVAGSAAAGWQASLGLVQAGSLFSWCQSAAMGGAAAGVILATGLTGAGVAFSATVAGALDVVDDEEPLPDLKEMFLDSWKRAVKGKVEDEVEGKEEL